MLQILEKKGKPDNVVIKLDMAKAYDRVSWFFLMKVLRKMGFSNDLVDIIWRLISNNWYSVLINGQSHGFFHSTRGVKQGDPLSPALFILSAEVLSRSLNALFDDVQYVGYGLLKWSAQINHLAYADDTIIFASTDNYSLNRIVETLQEYEGESGQQINKEKSAFYLHQSTTTNMRVVVEECTGMSRGHFPLKYLGCLITHARKRKEHYVDLIRRVKDKLQAWKGNMLSFGGKEVLLSSVLQSIPIHVLSAIATPNCVMKELHRIFAKFYWSNKLTGRSKHWAAWEKVCLPKNEGGLGFRSMIDVSKDMYATLWWKFRTQNSLWANFMWNKYCKKQIPTLVQWKGGSQVWKQMLENREIIEQNLWWEPKGGTSSIWFDNWTSLGPLFLHPTEVHGCHSLDDIEVFLKDSGWDYNSMQEYLSSHIVDHVRQSMSRVRQSNG